MGAHGLMSQPAIQHTHTTTMCEIAVTKNLTPNRTEALVNLARVLYEENSHGLGIVAIHRDEGNESFEYRTYKSTEPDFEGGGVRSVFEAHPDAYRFAIHARLATAGGKGYEQTHPIRLHDCSECNVDMVMHNGVVTGHKTKRKRLSDDGHEFTTTVDSEVIAHHIGDVPDTLTPDGEDEEWEQPSLTGSLNWLAFTEDGILIRNNGKYSIEDDFIIVCDVRDGWKSESWDGDTDDGYTLVKPDGSIEFVENEGYSRAHTAGRRVSGATRSARGAYGYGWGSRARSGDADADGEETTSFRSSRQSKLRQRVHRSTREIPQRYLDLTDRETRANIYARSVDHEVGESPLSDHDGWYEADDYLYCFEHDHVGQMVCTECTDADDISVREVPIIRNYKLNALLNEGKRHNRQRAAVVAAEYCDDHNTIHLARTCPDCSAPDYDHDRGPRGGRSRAEGEALAEYWDDRDDSDEESLPVASQDGVEVIDMTEEAD